MTPGNLEKAGRRLLVFRWCPPGTYTMLWAYTDIEMYMGEEGRGRIRRSVKHSIVSWSSSVAMVVRCTRESVWRCWYRRDVEERRGRFGYRGPAYLPFLPSSVFS
jgi:hypothetical protein